MNILLHICCAPCAIYPIESMRKDGHQLAGYFYNPNIHPYSEYLKRMVEVEKLAKETGLNVIYGDYDIENYFRNTVYNEEPASSEASFANRCPPCWWMRLEKAGKYAKDNGFEAFTTTLLGSPYQDVEVVKSIGEDVAGRLGLKFFISDFAKGFKAAYDTAKAKGIYSQNYCGCVFSEKERLEKKQKKVSGAGAAAAEIVLSVKGGKKKIRCSI